MKFLWLPVVLGCFLFGSFVQKNYDILSVDWLSYHVFGYTDTCTGKIVSSDDAAFTLAKKVLLPRTRRAAVHEVVDINKTRKNQESAELIKLRIFSQTKVTGKLETWTNEVTITDCGTVLAVAKI